VVAEHDNIRAALHGYRSAPAGAEDELRLAATMGQFWRSQHVSEGRRRLGEALQRASGAPSRARAAALDWLATIEVVYGDPSTGDALARESLTVARAVGDLARAASALRRLAMATRDDDPAARVAFLQEGLECARAAGADAEAAMLLAFLGAVAAEAGEMDRVRDLLEEGDALGRRSGDAFGWVQPLAQLGWLAVQDGRLEDAEAHFQHSLEIAEGIGYAGAVGMSLIALGQVALRRGDLTGARALHCRGLLVLRDEGGAYLASGLRYAAAVEAAAGEADRAQRLLGASEVWHAARGGAQRVWLAVTHGPLKRGLVPSPPEPTDSALIRARAEGRGMTIDQATDSVLRSSDMATRAQPTAAAT
jgi:tetratricopeptide (TPR) repeat protein